MYYYFLSFISIIAVALFVVPSPYTLVFELAELSLNKSRTDNSKFTSSSDAPIFISVSTLIFTDRQNLLASHPLSKQRPRNALNELI